VRYVVYVLCVFVVTTAVAEESDWRTAWDGTLYGYESGWTDTNFTRTVKVHAVGGAQDEIRVTVTVTWRTGSFQTRSFSISEDMYRWVNDGSGASS